MYLDPLTEIRNAYEEKLEEAHLEAIAAYSLFPEEETEEKLLNYSQAFVALANPIARAKYDDEIQLDQTSNQKQLHNIEKKNTSEITLKKPSLSRIHIRYPHLREVSLIKYRPIIEACQ